MTRTRSPAVLALALVAAVGLTAPALGGPGDRGGAGPGSGRSGTSDSSAAPRLGADGHTPTCTVERVDGVAYCTDRIVLRQAGLTSQAARCAVERVARGLLGRPAITCPSAPPAGALVTAVDTIDLPPGPEAVTPAFVVWFDLVEAPPGFVVDLAHRLRATGPAASPDYVMDVHSGSDQAWPHGYPTPAPRLPRPRPGRPGDGVTIHVYDTGVPAPGEYRPPRTTVELAPFDREALDADPADGYVDHAHGGHGIAIGGVLATLAPGAPVSVGRITAADGVITDVSAAHRMAVELRRIPRVPDWPDLIVTSFGSAVCEDAPAPCAVGASGGPPMVPLALEAVVDAIDHQGRAVLVASAGNEGVAVESYPAAFADVLGVGALDATADADGSPWTDPSGAGEIADFSNRGSWVDVWAPGVALPTTHVTGLAFAPGEPTLHGRAYVDGTSFSSPYVAARIAEELAEMRRPPGATATAEQAGRRVLADGVRLADPTESGVAVTLDVGWPER